MNIQPGDTLQSCLARLLSSGDFKEPLAQYLAEIIQTFGAGGGAPPAPPDLSGLVKKTGDTMTGTLEIDDPGGAGNTVLKVFDTTNSRYVLLVASGVIYIQAGGVQTGIAADGQGNLSVTNGYGLLLGNTAVTKIHVDATTGDVIATATVGPNSGKSVNLTVGKWA